MIESLFFTLACIAGLALGFVFGHRRGFMAGAKTSPFSHFQSVQGSSLPFLLTETPMSRCQIKRRLPVSRTPDERMLISTSAVREMCDDIARKLLADRIIRPVILEETEPGGIPLVIGCSILVAADPSYDRYLNLTFFEIPLSQ